MEVLRQVIAIALVFGLLWMTLRWLRKKGTLQLVRRHKTARQAVLESRGRLTLGPQHSLHLVRIGDREVVLALHPAGMVLLCDVPVDRSVPKP
jgi:flagellar biogenesis protein FliO